MTDAMKVKEALVSRDEVSAEDRRIMGSPEAAKLALIKQTQEWRQLRQPVMANRAALKDIDAREREARFQLANAAALWLWHEEHPSTPSPAVLDPVTVEARQFVGRIEHLASSNSRIAEFKDRKMLVDACRVIRRALIGQPRNAEAVAWRTKNDFGYWHVTTDAALAKAWAEEEKLPVEPLYASPSNPQETSGAFEGLSDAIAEKDSLRKFAQPDKEGS